MSCIPQDVGKRAIGEIVRKTVLEVHIWGSHVWRSRQSSVASPGTWESKLGISKGLGGLPAEEEEPQGPHVSLWEPVSCI